jgi:hypothetical protein
VERRAEGVLLVDTVNLSTARFPGTGSVAQAAVLLAVEMADRVVDPDRRRVRRFSPPAPHEEHAALLAAIDVGLPTATLVRLDAEPEVDPAAVSSFSEDQDGFSEDQDDAADQPWRLPFITDSFLRASTVQLLARYGSVFGALWHADPDRLKAEAVALLARFGAVTVVPGGVLVRPLVGRYRNTVAEVKKRVAPATLF